jgi:hypothetical protein
VISFVSIAGMVVVIIAAAAIFFLALPERKRPTRTLRPITAFQHLKRAIGLAVEDGKRLHVSIGKSTLANVESASSLVGLSTLERITQLTMISDRPPIATSGEGALSILSQDTMRAAYRNGNALDQYDPDRGRLAGPTPLSFVAGTLPIIYDENISAHILVGSFGPEAGLLVEAIEQRKGFSLTASDSLPAQSVLFVASDEPLIGEELYAIPAYLQAGPFHISSLRAQDILRWIIIGAIMAGSALKVLRII